MKKCKERSHCERTCEQLSFPVLLEDREKMQTQINELQTQINELENERREQSIEINELKREVKDLT